MSGPSIAPGPGPYDAVVFDLLTAVIDSWTVWNKAAGSDEVGLRWRREYLRLTYGCGPYRPYEEIVRDAAVAIGLDGREAGTLATLWSELQPWPEAVAVLKALAGRVPLGVATNCSASLGARAVERVGVSFAVVVTAEDAGFYKPRPEPYRAVLERLGTDPARTLFVAGSPADVPGASGIGMPVVWHNRLGLPAVTDAVRPILTIATLDPLLDLV